MIYILVYVGVVISIFAMLSVWYLAMLLLEPYFTAMCNKLYDTKVMKKIIGRYKK